MKDMVNNLTTREADIADFYYIKGARAAMLRIEAGKGYLDYFREEINEMVARLNARANPKGGTQ